MIPTVTARTALAQTTYWDGEKRNRVTCCIYTRLNRQVRQYAIAARQLQRCIDQLAALERWREGPNVARSATTRAPGLRR